MDDRPNENPTIARYVSISLFFLVSSFAALNFDFAIASAHQERLLPGDFRRIIRLSELFAHGFGLALIVIAVLVLAPTMKRRLPRLVLCGVLASVFAHLFKMGFVRLRPSAYRNEVYQYELPDSVTASWTMVNEQLKDSIVGDSYFVQSFPSAHSAMAVGVAVGLCWLLPRGRWLFIGLAALACYQRIQAHAHWTSDVLAGAAIGTLVAGLLIQDWGLGWVLGRYEQASDSSSELSRNRIANS